MKQPIPKPPSKGEAELAFHLKCHNVLAETEFRFDPSRKWRADFLVRPRMLIEVEGGTRQGGRHSRHEGFSGDCEKYNQAQILGFIVLRFTTEQVSSGYAIDTILKAMHRNVVAELVPSISR